MQPGVKDGTKRELVARAAAGEAGVEELRLGKLYKQVLFTSQ